MYVYFTILLMAIISAISIYFSDMKEWFKVGSVLAVFLFTICSIVSVDYYLGKAKQVDAVPVTLMVHGFTIEGNTIGLVTDIEDEKRFISFPYSDELAKALKKGRKAMKGGKFEIKLSGKEGSDGEGNKGNGKEGEEDSEGKSISVRAIANVEFKSPAVEMPKKD